MCMQAERADTESSCGDVRLHQRKIVVSNDKNLISFPRNRFVSFPAASKGPELACGTLAQDLCKSMGTRQEIVKTQMVVEG